MQRDDVDRLTDPSASLQLATLLAERLCHDLGGALGTVAGALELAEDADDAREALPLAREASAALLSRFRLLRAAWGGASDASPVATLRVLTAWLPNRRVRANMERLTAASVIPGDAGRILLNLVLLGMECLPDGGEVVLAGDGSVEVVVTLSGSRAAWPPGLGRLLADPHAAWDAVEAARDNGGRTLQAPLVALMAREAGLGLSMLVGVGSSSDTPPLLLRCRREG